METIPAVGSLEDLIDTIRVEKAALADQYAIQSLGVFGSFVRGEAAADKTC